jgi:hypothetical protein
MSEQVECCKSPGFMAVNCLIWRHTATRARLWSRTRDGRLQQVPTKQGGFVKDAAPRSA